MLAKSDEIPPFICPESKQPLIKKADTWQTEDGAHVYSIVDGFPVLIDFENSVLDENNYHSLKVPEVVERKKYSGLLGLAKKLVSPSKSATRDNVQQFIRLLKENSISSKHKVLIIGGGTVGQGMQPLYDAENIQVISFDVYSSKNVHLVADAHSIPFHCESFDGIIIQAVLEHVLEPWNVAQEIHRVLKSGGLVYSETPFLQHVHEGAYDFTRFTESGHRYLFKSFSLIKSGASAGAGTQLSWAIDNFFRGLFRSRKAGKIMKLLFFWLLYIDDVIPEKYNVDAASGCFFLGRKADVDITAEEAIEHYQGAQHS